MSTAQKKWKFCSVCRRNHDGGRKHIFTAGHKGKLSTLMVKFSKKVSFYDVEYMSTVNVVIHADGVKDCVLILVQVRSARRCLGHPNILEGELEPGPGGKMWCYCCQQEVDKHVTNGLVSVEWAGLLDHMTK